MGSSPQRLRILEHKRSGRLYIVTLPTATHILALHFSCAKTYLNLCPLLVQALPAGVILFCMIDGKSLYEKDDYLGETYHILRIIGDLTRESEAAMIFKLLITSSLANQCISRYILNTENYLVLPHNLGRGCDSFVYNRQLMMQLRRMISCAAAITNPVTSVPLEIAAPNLYGKFAKRDINA